MTMVDVSAPNSRVINDDVTFDGVTRLSAIRLTGYAVLLGFVVGFGIWASTAPIAGAVIVEGTVTASNRNHLVQLPRDGIIDRVLVTEGDRVERGDVLFKMDDRLQTAQLRRLQRQDLGLRAQIARLDAERLALENVDFSDTMKAEAARLGAQDLLDQQLAEFEARRQREQSEEFILAKRTETQRQSIIGFERQMQALDEQIAIISEEAQRKQQLLGQGLTNRSEYTELLRANAGLVGQRGAIASQIESTRTDLLRSEEELVRLRSLAIETAAATINQLNLRREDLIEQISVAQGDIERTTVRSGTDGVVIQMAVMTPGAVVSAGDTLATVLPTQDDLIIDGRMALQDIDLVSPGQDAKLRFTALNQRVTPEVPGRVIFISPDAIADNNTGTTYYAVRLRPTELPPEINPGDIYPGMPVSSLIATPDRTFFEYLLKPFVDSFRLAFREE